MPDDDDVVAIATLLMNYNELRRLQTVLDDDDAVAIATLLMNYVAYKPCLMMTMRLL